MPSGLQPTVLANSFMGGAQDGSSTKTTATQRVFAANSFRRGGKCQFEIICSIAVP
jgi:hypothetical protein